MKLTSLVLIGALLAGAYTQAQTPAAPSSTAGRQEAIPPACKEALKRLCSGKQGQDAVSCLKSNADKLPAKCKEHFSKQ